MCAGDGPETAEEMAVIERKREAALRQADIGRLFHAALLVEDPLARCDREERLAISRVCRRIAAQLEGLA